MRIPVSHGHIDGDLVVSANGPRCGTVRARQWQQPSQLANRYVAHELNNAGLATLLIDLLTPAEERIDDETGRLRFDIPLLARRLSAAVDCYAPMTPHATLPLAVSAPAPAVAPRWSQRPNCPNDIVAVVSRGGRPDLPPMPCRASKHLHSSSWVAVTSPSSA